MGWTLNRYFLLHYLKITVYFLVGIFILALLMDFTFNAGRLSGLPGYSALGAFTVSMLRIPFFMQKLLPFVALFAAMAALMTLNKRNELVITRSVGISAWQFLLPLLLGSFILGILAIFVLNPLAAKGSEKAEDMLASWRGDGGIVTAAAQMIPWLIQKTDEGTTIIGAKAFLERGKFLVNAQFIQFKSDGHVDSWIDAQSAILQKGNWVLKNASKHRSGQPPEFVDEMLIPTGLKPQYVEQRLADPETIPFFELPHMIKLAKSYGFSANKFDMHFQSLVALPALLVAMTLIAATVSLRFARFGQSSLAILAGIFCGFVLYVISELVQAFGIAGIVLPVIAAWVPVLIAFFFSISFLLHKEDG